MENIDKVLYKYPKAKIQIEIDNIKLEEIENNLCDIKAYSYDNISVSSSNINNSTEDAAIELLHKKEEINKRIKYNTLFCNKIEKALQVLSNIERLIIESYYFQNIKDYEIYLDFSYGISKAVYYKTKKSAKEKLKNLI